MIALVTSCTITKLDRRKMFNLKVKLVYWLINYRLIN